MIEVLVASITLFRACFFLCSSLFLYACFRRLHLSRQISRLGSRAPEFRSHLPFGLDFIYGVAKASSKCQEIEFFEAALSSARGEREFGFSPTTAELNSGSGSRLLFTTDPENIRAILSAQFADYGKGEKFHRDWKELAGNSVFSTDGELWSYGRHILRPLFVKERTSDTKIFEKHIQKLIHLFNGVESKNPTDPVDIVPLLYRFTMDAATNYLLGGGTDTLSNRETRVAEAFKHVLRRQAEFFIWDDFSFLLSRKKYRKELKILDDFIAPYIKEVLSFSSEELDKKLSKKDTFLESLARSSRDPAFIRDQVLTLLIAGRDTTAASLSFCLFEIARNSEIADKLRAELDYQLGGRAPGYNDLQEMKYLQAILNETFRIYPAVPMNFRDALKNTTLPRGGGKDGLSPIGILKDTRILFASKTLQSRPDLFPDQTCKEYFDPKKFCPERWLSGWKPKPWEYIPFHRGQRSCIGQQFATNEMAYTVARIMQEFEVIEAVSKDNLLLRTEVTMCPEDGIKCYFLKRGGERTDYP